MPCVICTFHSRAAIGHAIGAQQKYLRQESGVEEWKMSKFKTVPSKVRGKAGNEQIPRDSAQKQMSGS